MGARRAPEINVIAYLACDCRRYPAPERLADRPCSYLGPAISRAAVMEFALFYRA
jgi:hypothetical protein